MGSRTWGVMASKMCINSISLIIAKWIVWVSTPWICNVIEDFKMGILYVEVCFKDTAIIQWKVKEKVKSLSRVQLFATSWTVAYQAPLSMGFSRQEYWKWVAIPISRESSWPRDQTQVSCTAGRLSFEPPGKPKWVGNTILQLNVVLLNCSSN